jgi:hypothetical protein
MPTLPHQEDSGDGAAFHFDAGPIKTRTGGSCPAVLLSASATGLASTPDTRDVAPAVSFQLPATIPVELGVPTGYVVLRVVVDLVDAVEASRDSFRRPRIRAALGGAVVRSNEQQSRRWCSWAAAVLSNREKSSRRVQAEPESRTQLVHCAISNLRDAAKKI